MVRQWGCCGCAARARRGCAGVKVSGAAVPGRFPRPGTDPAALTAPGRRGLTRAWS
jgi:hypothetical protein